MSGQIYAFLLAAPDIDTGTSVVLLPSLAALPPRLYEILNCAIMTTSFVALCICLRYLVSEYLLLRAAGNTVWRSVGAMWEFKLAIAFTIMLSGEFPRMAWVWLARYLGNRHDPTAWMATEPWVLVPIIASLTSCLGLACVVRALTPRAWGEYGYVLAIGSATCTVVLTQLLR